MRIINPMDYAIKLANKCKRNGEVPVGCVIVDDQGNIVTYASNSMIKNNDPTAHAEILAIRKACKKKKTQKLIDFSLYVTLEPCEMCEAAIYQVGIKKVFLVHMQKTLSCIRIKKKNYSNEQKGYQYFGGFKEKTCTKLVKDFFKDLR